MLSVFVSLSAWLSVSVSLSAPALTTGAGHLPQGQLTRGKDAIEWIMIYIYLKQILLNAQQLENKTI